jgi:glycine cleavage system protein P-like pyridoxal-binding family
VQAVVLCPGWVLLLGAPLFRLHNVARQWAMLKANYMAKRLGKHYPVLYTGARVAHSFGVWVVLGLGRACVWWVGVVSMWS